ncbi:MAG: MaoC family dehydratase N-terminal domain-containing protein [Ktedonobacterales bacterium]|nr:MaoC family dehydratase N-terminal domain-containing protein [Ktedonobacterales bacterium]
MGISADLMVGQIATVARTISDADVALFALITGDHHPLHLDAHYAHATRFGQRIVPAALVSGIVEAALAATIPGKYAIICAQALAFAVPMLVEDTLTITITLMALDHATAHAHCGVVATRNDGAEVVRGTVTLQIEDLPDFEEN